MESKNEESNASMKLLVSTNRLIIIISIGVIVGLVFNYFNSGKFQLQELLRFSPLSLALAFVLAISPWLVHAVEIIIWTRFFKKDIGFKSALRISIATDLGSIITPTMVGGAAIKLTMLVRKDLSKGQAAAMVFLTGLEDMVFFLVVIPLSIIYSDRIGINIINEIIAKLTGMFSNMLIMGGILVGIIILVGYLFKRYNWGTKIREKIKSTISDFKAAIALTFKNGKTTFLLATLAIGARWIARFFILICLIKGFGVIIDYKEAYLSEWMVYLGMTVTPTPGAIGGAEGTFLLVYNNLIPLESIGTIMFAWRFFNYYLLLMLAILFINLTNRWRLKKQS